MAIAEKNGAITIEGIDELNRKLEQLKTQGTGFEKRLREAIRKILGQARAELRKDAASGLDIKNDPRHAYKAVRYAVYKRILGGQVNILQSRRAGNRTNYEPERTLNASKRGGNRRTRSPRTKKVMEYEGVDRGFILRFLNNGMTKTNPRTIRFTENDRRKVDKWNKHPNTGNRGAITARNWFGDASHQQLEIAAGKLQELIDRIINDEFK